MSPDDTIDGPSKVIPPARCARTRILIQFQARYTGIFDGFITRLVHICPYLDILTWKHDSIPRIIDVGKNCIEIACMTVDIS